MKKEESKNEELVEIDIDSCEEEISGGSLKDVHTRPTQTVDNRSILSPKIVFAVFGDVTLK